MKTENNERNEINRAQVLLIRDCLHKNELNAYIKKISKMLRIIYDVDKEAFKTNPKILELRDIKMRLKKIRDDLERW